MAEFKIEIAGQTAFVTSLFESTPHYCGAYRTENPPDFSITVTQADIEFEREKTVEEALAEGFRLRQFTDPFLERAAIQRRFAEHLFDQDTLLFHGSLVAVDGRGYLFTAKSGTGKSTHTRYWCQTFGDRAVMVNDDKPFLQISDSGVAAFGSPWSGKHGLDANICVPLQGICLLERGGENRIRPAAPEELLPMLLRQSYQPLDRAKQPRLRQLAEAMTRTTRLWQMECTKDPGAALVSYAAMSGQPL